MYYAIIGTKDKGSLFWGCLISHRRCVVYKFYVEETIMPKQYFDGEIAKSPRIQQMIDYLFADLPVIEADRAEIVTDSYKQTENDPIVLRRAKAFQAI